MSQHITHWFGASRSSMIRNVRERFSGLMSGFDPPDLDRADKAAASSGAPGPLTFKFKERRPYSGEVGDTYFLHIGYGFGHNFLPISVFARGIGTLLAFS